MSKIALITGITGQDGSYLAELLLSKGYEVHGIIRRASSFNTGRIDHIFDRLHLHHGDVTEPARIERIVADVQPNEVYNLAAQSHVRVSFDEPHYTFESIATGTLNVLDAVLRHAPKARVYVASSSEMWGNSPPPQNEETPFAPVSPYGVAKVAAHHLAHAYRARGLFVACGILGNHESERRGPTFVTRKITRGLARIRAGLQDRLELGNIYARRDWGHADDYVRAMWMMLQQPEPDDFVIATGDCCSVREFLNACSEWHRRDGRNLPAYPVTAGIERLLRPVEIDLLCGDASKAFHILGWHPTVTFPDLVARMCSHDWAEAQRERAGKDI